MLCDGYPYFGVYQKCNTIYCVLKNETPQYIEKTGNFFPCIEYYESYYGFERKWDEEGNGEILETVGEYYNRGGKFTYIPNKYPSVVYFGLVDNDYLYSWSSARLKWVYCGE